MSSVTFPTAIGGDGSTVTDDDNATTGLRNGGWRTRFIPCFTNLVNIANYMVSYTAQTSTFAAPPPMGSTTPNTGAFTRVTVTGSTAPANGLYLPATNALGFATNSTERVRIDSSGNVGIGTSSPLTKITAASNAADVIAAYSTYSTGGGAVGGYNFYGQNNSGNPATYAAMYGNIVANTAGSHNGSLGLYTATSGSLTLKATLDSSGNLGLGVTPSGWSSSTKALEVGGWAAYSSVGGSAFVGFNSYATSTSAFAYKNSAAAMGYWQTTGGHAWFTAPSGTAGNAISFTQAMTLDASGSLLVGTTSTGWGNQNSFAWDAPGKYAIINHQNGTAAGTGYVLFGYNGAGIGSITQSGTTNVLYNTSSDQRLKTNITPAGSAIQSILDFPVDQFDWIESGEHQDFGAVAQKAINFIPEMVSVPANEDEMWGIDWSKAVPRLIKTVQELSAELNELKQRIN